MRLGQVHDKPDGSILLGGRANWGAVGLGERGVGERSSSVAPSYLPIDSVLDQFLVLIRRFVIFGESGRK